MTFSTQLKAIPFDSEIARLTERFTGREWVLEEIEDWLKLKNERFFVLIGEHGIGKSAIAAKIIQTKFQVVAAYHFCIAGRGETIQPNGVLLSLAAQLVEYFADYAESLVNVIKPLKLSVKVEINAQTIKDSDVRGIVIENLHTQCPKEALDIILRRTFDELPNPPEKPVLIIIDSLDEAVTYGDKENLVTLLSAINGLPSWLRLIVTTCRDEQRVLSYLKMLSPHFCDLDKQPQKGLEDIHAYVNSRITCDAIKTRMKVDCQIFLEHITNFSEGNFLYTKVLLDDIEAAGQDITLNKLDSLPKGLDEFYHQFLMRIKTEWAAKYQFIFGILTVTKFPLTNVELINFISNNPEIDGSPNESQLNHALGVVKQFFDVVRDVHGKESYRLFHQSLREYLTDQKRNPNFWCSPKDGHRWVVDYCWRYHPNDWSECVRYGLRYLSAHIVDLANSESLPVYKKRWIEKLHLLLSTEVNGCNAWFVAKKNIGDISGYLSDVSKAWEIADQHTNQQESLELQCRYLLITSSINSYVEIIPPSILAAQLQANQMTSTEILTYAYQISDPFKKAEALSTLLPFLPPDLHSDVIKKALCAASNCVGGLSRAKMQLTIVKHITELESQNFEQEKIFADILRIKSEWEKTDTLVTVAPILPEHLLEKALKAIQQIKDEYNQEKAVVALLPRLSKDKELMRQVLQIFSTREMKCKPAFMVAEIPYLTEPKRMIFLKQALDYTKAMVKTKSSQDDEYWQASALEIMAPHLTEPLLHQALDIVQRYHARPEFYDRARVALAIRFVEIGSGEKALALISSIIKSFLQVEALAILHSRLLGFQQKQSLTIARNIAYPYWRANALGILFLHTPNSDKPFDLIEEALSELNINDADERVQTLVVLAGYLQDYWNQVFELVVRIKDSRDRALTLVKMASYLPIDFLEKVIKIALQLESDSHEEKVLAAIVPRTSESILIQTQLLQRVSSKRLDFEKVFISLIPYLFDSLVPEAFEIALDLNDAEILAALVPRLSATQLERVRGYIGSLKKENDRICLLAAIALNHDKAERKNIVDFLLKNELEIQNYGTDYVRSVFALCLAKQEYYSIALNIAGAIQDGNTKTETLTQLIPLLLESELPKVVNLSQCLKWDEELRVLAKLPLHISMNPLTKIIDSTLNFKEVCKADDYYKALVNQAFVPLLNYKNISINQRSLLFLRSIETANLILDMKCRLQTLQAISPYLYDKNVRENRDFLSRILKDTFHKIKNWNRKEVLAALQILSIYIFALGGVNAVKQTYNAIQEVGGMVGIKIISTRALLK